MTKLFFRLRPLFVPLLFSSLGGGCTLVTSADELSEGCPEGTKLCEGKCVSTSDTDFGCASSSCSPCALSQATARCSAEGECVIASCVGTYEDCDQETLNGCEVNTDQDKENCGGCDEPCEDHDRGEAACGNANCYMRLCDEGFGDCNSNYVDGCEFAFSDDEERCPEP